ncbi:MAG: thioesterase family protein [Alphaproteobacteria bacterium]|nr:thioesterase family protein [Rhodospirillales bacterium]MCW9045838.1 thioesterase family protein [Alphaproteobacteria bacterium]
MHLIFRGAFAAVRASRRPQLAPLEESVVSFRVWLNDLDTNFHMTNGRYLTVMDLGKIDLGIRSPFFVTLMRKKKWRPILGGALIRYAAPVHLFEKCTLRTRIVGWDEKWFYMEHRLEVRGKLAALSIVKGLFRVPGKSISSAEMAVAMGVDPISPQLPQYVADWVDSEKSFDEEVEREQ